MELSAKKKLHLISGRAHPALAEEVAAILEVDLVDANLSDFANGEIFCKFAESVRGGDVFILQTHASTADMSINDAIMEHLIMVDAAGRASAKRTTVVAPFNGYARQDRKASGREPITAKLVADQFRVAGASRMVSVDLHSNQLQGFFEGPWDHLVAMPVLCDALGKLADDLVVVSPDAGRVKVAERYAQKLDADLAIVHKRRLPNKENAVEAKDVVGDVSGKPCVLIDDMIDTGGTIVAAAELLKEKGASKVIAATTHGVFSGRAIERIENSCIEKVVVTNTLPLTRLIDKIEVVSIAPLIAAAIKGIFEDTSVSEIFGGGNYN
jgi:ribose-phosphate pyrophosphokinase